jgi:hypothetical protein
MKPYLTRLSLLAGGAIAAAALVACGGGGGGSSSTPTSTAGTLSVSLTDAPACGFSAVNVTVLKVRVNKSATASDTDSGWTDIAMPTGGTKINLLDWNNGAAKQLGSTTLDPGHYSQIRLVLDPNNSGTANTVVPTGSSTEQSLDTPSAVQSGIKLNGEFDVAAGTKADVTIDFDACKSIVTKGNGKYALKPVIKMVPSVINGISGYVPTTALASNVMVSAEQGGKVIASTAPDSTGQFYLARLVPGNYDVVITADNSPAYVVGAVPVASTTSVTQLSTQAAPLTLAASTMGSISGTVTLPANATSTAYVAAKQTVGTNTVVTVKSQAADASTGAYTIANLSIAAPQYVAYTATLPLTFTASASTAAGKYTVEASADGYTTQTLATPVDITAGNQTGVNFTNFVAAP